MFSIGQANFANGVYAKNGQINGFQAMIMESDAAADRIIRDFEEILKNEVDPYVAIDQAFEKNNLTQDDFTDFDLDKINKKVNAIYRSKMNRGY